MVAAMWMKTDQKGYRGQTRRPVLWDDNGRLVTDVRDGAGRPVLDRVPAIGFDGSDIHNMRPIKGVKRFVDYLRHDGHIAHVPLTNAAAHIPDEDESCQRDRRLKAKHFGWIEWPSTGVSRCPCAMANAGEINVEQLNSPACYRPAQTESELASQKADHEAWRGDVAAHAQWWGRSCGIHDVGPGKPPCIHAIAERKARRAARAGETARREEMARSEESKAAQAQTEATRTQTAALMELAEKQAAIIERLSRTEATKK